MIHDKADLAQKMIDVRYDLGPMNKVCHYCKGKGFEREVKGQWSDPDDPDNILEVNIYEYQMTRSWFIYQMRSLPYYWHVGIQSHPRLILWTSGCS